MGKACGEFIGGEDPVLCALTEGRQVADASEWVLLATEMEILRTVVPVRIGGRLHLVSNFVDITSQEKAQREMVESGARMQALFNATTDSVMLDTAGTVLALNYMAANRRRKWIGFLLGIIRLFPAGDRRRPQGQD